MAASGQGLYTRSLDEVRELMLERAREHRNPFDHTPYDGAERAFAAMDRLDRDVWAEAFSAEARPHHQRARSAEAAGDAATAAREYLAAYGLYRVARYPAPNSPAKREAYRLSLETYLKAAEAFDPPVQRVVAPFRGRPGEGDHAVGLLRLPRRDSGGVAGVSGGNRAAGRPPVVIIWGGIDSFKEERRTDEYVEAGMATLSVDMPGVGEAPLAGSEDAERLWDAWLDWIAGRPDLDAGRVALVGGSTGGYWATKVAHTHRERLRAAVNHGGPAHHAFTAEWIARSTRGEYPFELPETLACAFGRATAEEWLAFAPRLSLLDQGVLDRPCCPLLCINGVDDSVFPIADHHILLEHGNPKSARFFPGGHMGHAPGMMPALLGWLKAQLEI
jgi:esterase FrsA